MAPSILESSVPPYAICQASSFLAAVKRFSVNSSTWPLWLNIILSPTIFRVLTISVILISAASKFPAVSSRFEFELGVPAVTVAVQTVSEVHSTLWTVLFLPATYITSSSLLDISKFWISLTWVPVAPADPLHFLKWKALLCWITGTPLTIVVW